MGFPIQESLKELTFFWAGGREKFSPYRFRMSTDIGFFAHQLFLSLILNNETSSCGNDVTKLYFFKYFF